MNPETIARVFLSLVTLILSVTVHEYAHALAADKLGDDLPAREGRLTLNPMAHIDPIGTLLLPVLAMFSPIMIFGWGRPVRTNPINYTRRFSMRGGEAMVAFAGPLSNFLMAIVCGVLWVVAVRFQLIDGQSPFNLFLKSMMQINLTLFFLNLIPVPPLDGSKVLSWIFGYRIDKLLDGIAGMGMIALYAVLLISGSAIAWATNFAYHAILVGLSAVLI